MAGMLQRAVNILYRLDLLEARVGIEPTNKGFADLCLTSLSPSGSSSERRFVTLRASSMTVALRRPPSPLPRLHRLRVAPQPTLRIPRLLRQIPQHRLPACALLIPPCQPGANNLLVQVPPIRQDGLGGSAFVPIDVADLHRDRLSESQSPVELLGACPMAASSRSRRSTKAGSVLTCHCASYGWWRQPCRRHLAGEIFGVEDGNGDARNRSSNPRATKSSLPQGARTLRASPCSNTNPYLDRNSTRLNSSHRCISYAVFRF